jgi:hypothetical protein
VGLNGIKGLRTLVEAYSSTGTPWHYKITILWHCPFKLAALPLYQWAICTPKSWRKKFFLWRRIHENVAFCQYLDRSRY